MEQMLTCSFCAKQNETFESERNRWQCENVSATPTASSALPCTGTVLPGCKARECRKMGSYGQGHLEN